MVQILPEGEGNIFGRIGSSLGKSLAEQVPKEVERYRLSKGLERLTKQANEGNLSPLETISKLYGVPGLSPEAAGSILPYLKAQEGRSQRIQQEPETMSAGEPTDKSIKPKRQQSYFERLNSGTFLQGFSPEEKQQKISDFLKARPFSTEEEAIAKIDKQEADQISFDTLLNAKKDRIEKEVSSLINEFTQKKGNEVYADITGKLQQGTYIPKAISDVLDKGIGEKQAALKIANDALEFAKSKNKLKELGRGLGVGPSTSKQSLYNSLKETRKSYADRGLLEDFRDDLISYQKLSPEWANYFTYPISQNTELKKELDSIPNVTRVNERIGIGGNIDKIVEKISNKIRPSDSLDSISLYLEDKGYDSVQIMKALSKAKDENKISLSAKQSNEIKENPNFYSTLGDWWFRSALKLINKGTT